MSLTLIFQLADETYGLDIEMIQEIIEDLPVHYLPFRSTVMPGAVNFHGRIVPVIDLPVLLGFAEGVRDHRLIVYAEAEHAMAFRVSKVGRIVALPRDQIQAPPADRGLSAISGVADLQGTMVNLLDTGIVLNRLAQCVSP